MDRLVLLDSNSLLNRAFYALPPMNALDGRPTNAVYGYLNMLVKIINEIEPSHIIATFDVKAPTFRKEMYADYKAGRKPMPEELVAQLPIIKELLSCMGVQIVELAGYEADDLIGTLARKCPFETVIVTGDRDSLQLVSDTTTVWLTKRGISEVIKYDIARLAEDGLTPLGVIDLKSLMGDASDNIPGVAGVGEKTAKSLLEKYGSLDGVYANIDSITGKLKEKLASNRETAYLSYRLATINQDSPVEFDAEASLLKLPFDSSVRDMLRSLNFKSMVDKVPCEENAKDSGVVVTKCSVEYIADRELLTKLREKINGCKKVAVYLGESVHIAVGDDIEYIVNINNDLLCEGIGFEDIATFLKELFADGEIVKIGVDIKSVLHTISAERAESYQDILLKAYLIDATRSYKSLEDIQDDYGYTGDCKANIILSLDSALDDKLNEYGMSELYSDIELPLIDVLYRMEKSGCRIDIDLLSELRDKFLDEMTELTERIYQESGERFNINSPQQLGVVLFEKLQLRHGKKNRKGYSTDVEVLKSIQFDHPVVPLVLRYRELSKLLSTYIDGMGGLVQNGRVHTIFKQTVTATGRLSSTEPNLQNIPVRRAEGRELRKMFVASDGCQLLCADYSQIELRLLAHMSGDPVLIDAFNRNYDVHSSTASLVFGVPLEMVTSEMRRQAKAVNFGIIYGISAFGLSSDLGISAAQAKRFIDKYFETYPNVKGYMNECVEKAKVDGYVSTILGRRRRIPELKSTNYNVRNFGERAAMNMPLQGSASDIIKKAMIDVDRAIRQGGYKARLILQVHDELLIDCPNEELENVTELLRRYMENVMSLKVKLTVEISSGDNWYEAK